MIDYYIDLFTKPKYLWSSIDELALIGLILAFLIIIFSIWFLVYWICLSICDKKHSRCVNMKLSGFDSYRCQNKKCMCCEKYKTKEDL